MRDAEQRVPQVTGGGTEKPAPPRLWKSSAATSGTATPPSSPTTSPARTSPAGSPEPSPTATLGRQLAAIERDLSQYHVPAVGRATGVRRRPGRTRAGRGTGGVEAAAGGVLPQPAVGTGQWWELRPAWFALLTLVLLPLVVAVMRAERPMLRLPAALGRGRPVWVTNLDR